MPTRALRHKPTHQKTRQEYDRQRNPAKNQIYDRTWRKLRNAFLASNPLCVECRRQGLILEATEVDHIEPIIKAPHRRLDETNLQPLCRSCHAAKTYRETLA